MKGVAFVNMKKKVLRLVKKAVKKTVIHSANTTTSFWHHQPKAPESIANYKK